MSLTKPDREPDFINEGEFYWWEEMITTSVANRVMDLMMVNRVLCYIDSGSLYKERIAAQEAFADYLDQLLLGEEA